MNHHIPYNSCVTLVALFSQSSKKLFLLLDKTCCSLFHNEPPNSIYNSFFTVVALFLSLSSKFLSVDKACRIWYHNDGIFCRVCKIKYTVYVINAAIVKKALLQLF